MPYKGVPKEQTAKLDRCVNGVMAQIRKNPKKYRVTEKRTPKSIAIAICRDTMKI